MYATQGTVTAQITDGVGGSCWPLLHKLHLHLEDALAEVRVPAVGGPRPADTEQQDVLGVLGVGLSQIRGGGRVPHARPARIDAGGTAPRGRSCTARMLLAKGEGFG